MVSRLVLNVFILVFFHAVFIVLIIFNVHIEVVRHHILMVRLLLLRELDFLNSVQFIILVFLSLRVFYVLRLICNVLNITLLVIE